MCLGFLVGIRRLGSVARRGVARRGAVAPRSGEAGRRTAQRGAARRSTVARLSARRRGAAARLVAWQLGVWLGGQLGGVGLFFVCAFISFSPFSKLHLKARNTGALAQPPFLITTARLSFRNPPPSSPPHGYKNRRRGRGARRCERGAAAPTTGGPAAGGGPVSCSAFRKRRRKRTSAPAFASYLRSKSRRLRSEVRRPPSMALSPVPRRWPCRICVVWGLRAAVTTKNAMFGQKLAI